MGEIINQELNDVLSNTLIQWEKFYGKNVLITGATGLLGSLIVQTLCLNNERNSANTKIYACCRNIEKAKKILPSKSNIIFVDGDIRNPIIIKDKIDYIVHAASITSSKTMVSDPVGTIEVAVNGTQNILELAKKNNVAGMIYLSSMEVYGITFEEQNPITEDKLGYIDLSDIRSCYSEGKRMCELLCNCYSKQYDVRVNIARLAQTFGPGVNISDNRMPVQFAKSVIKNENIILHTEGKSVLNFCYVFDAIKAIFLILLSDKKGEIYNVCNDKETRSVLEIAAMVSKIRNHVDVKFDIPDTNQYGYAPNVVSRLCSDKLRDLGWNPTIDLKEAYLKLIDYIECE